MSTMNRIGNSKNPYQGDYKKVLTVCSASLLRSPTAAHVLCQEPYNYNTRCAGYSQEYALTPVDEVLLSWADEIVCMEQKHADVIAQITNQKIYVLDIPDRFRYRDPELIDLIKKKYDEVVLKKQVTEV